MSPLTNSNARGRSDVVRLRRTMWSRLRLAGLLEIFSYLLLLVPVLAVRDELTGHRAWLGASDVLWTIGILAAGIAIRVAVWTEYLEFDTAELRWRSLFRSHRWRLGIVEGIEVGKLWLFPGGPNWNQQVLVIRFANGVTRKIRCTAGCGATWQEFLERFRGVEVSEGCT